MNSIIKKIVCFWKVKQRKKKILQTFLKTYNIKLIVNRETSIVLSCLTPTLNKKTGKYDLVADDGIVLDRDLSISEATKKIEEYKKAAKRKKISFQEHLDELVISNKRKKRLKEILDEKVEGKWQDLDSFGKKDFSDHELETFVEIELIHKTKVKPSPEGSNSDVIGLEGRWKDKTFDSAGLPTNEGAIKQWNFKYVKSLNKFKKSIDTHFNKLSKNPPLDKYVLDLRNVDNYPPQTKGDILKYLHDNYSSFLKNKDKFEILE